MNRLSVDGEAGVAVVLASKSRVRMIFSAVFIRPEQVFWVVIYK
jgi:hypothetical protein